MGWAQGFESGSRAMKGIIDTYLQAKQRRELEDVAKATPETSQGFTAEQGDQLRAAAESGQYDIGYDQERGAYTVTPKADPNQTGVIAQQGVTDFLGQRRAGTMSDSDVGNARMMAMAGVVKKSNPTEGLRIEQQARQGEREDQRFEWEKSRVGREQREIDRKLGDDEELRLALREGRPGVPGGAGMLTGAMATQTPGTEPPTGRTAGQVRTAQPGGQFDLNSYLKNVAPRAIETLVKQGKLEEAKRFREFVATEEGRDYASAWVDGMRRYAIGDHAGALRSFEGMYNRQMFNDGNTVKLTPQDDGKNYRIEVFDKDGNTLGAKVQPTEAMANSAALFLEPSRAVEFHAKQESELQRESVKTDRQLEIERLRQGGREYAEDRRDDRLAQRLSAQSANLERRLEARGGLTAAQERSNFEIDAAREYIAGLDAAEIRRRTAKTTDTGRENPDYDPALAKAAALAARRKIGDDADFDNRSNRPQAAPSIDRQDVAKRFRADRAMNNYRLGKDTTNGVEVLDNTGKVIGHYR